MQQQRRPQTSSTFMRRFGYYALGISIGLMILGFAQMQRMATRPESGKQDSSAQAPATGSGDGAAEDLGG